MPGETRSTTSLKAHALKWKLRRDMPIAILAWIGVLAVFFWMASHIVRAIILLTVAALLAYALVPVVKLLQRFIPRFLAVFIVYIVFLSALSIMLYFIVNTAVHQTIIMARQTQAYLLPGPNGQISPTEVFLTKFGITHEQIAGFRSQITMHAEAVASNSLPLLRSIIDFVIDIIVVAILSIYLSLDGGRAIAWIRHNAPIVARANFALDTLQRVIGGYIRGQLTLALLIAILVWGGMEFIFHLPYAVFLGVLAFVMAFIPVFGTFISGTLCVLIGLAQSWLIAVGVLIYFVIIHVIESELVGPRLVGQAIGLHPIVSLLALIAGTELFGIWGTLFASPIAGVLQTTIITLWAEWRTLHPEQFHPRVHEELAAESAKNGPSA